MTTRTTTVLIGCLIAWVIYLRVRSAIGRQPLRRNRIIIYLVVFTLITFLVIATSWQFPKALLGLVVGILVGAALGFLGLRLTKFETTGEGHFYTPNKHIGIALSLLLVGRLINRMWVLDNVDLAKKVFQSPVTDFIFGLNLGYFIVYYLGMFVHLRDKKSATP
jgi:hypothetical protein